MTDPVFPLPETVAQRRPNHRPESGQGYKKLNGTVDPRADFGAVGNGSIDDTDRFQQALDTGLTVKPASGRTYKVEHLEGHDGQTLDLRGVTLLHKEAADDDLLTLSSNTDTHFELVGGYIDGNRANQSAARNAVNLSNASGPVSVARHRVVDTVITETKGSGLIIGVQTRGCMIRGVETYKNDEHGIVSGGNDCDYEQIICGQSGKSNLYAAADNCTYNGGKLWMAGQIDSSYSALLVERSNQSFGRFNIQQAQGDGVRVFRSGVDIEGIYLEAIIDSCNRAAGTAYALNLGDAYDSEYHIRVTNSLAAIDFPGVVTAAVRYAAGATRNVVFLSGPAAAYNSDAWTGTLLANKQWTAGVLET